MNFDDLVSASDIMRENRIAANTKKSYQSCIRQYYRTAILIDSFPDPDPITSVKARAFIEKYRTEVNKKTTYGYLRNFATAFSHHCKTNNIPNFTYNSDFREYFAGLKRTMHGGNTVNEKKPLIPDILNLFSQKSNKEISNDIQFMAISSLCFYGFLRINECMSLLIDDIVFENDSRIVLTIKVSKTDQTGIRANVYIHNSGTNYSPFIWLPLHLQKNGTTPDRKLFSWSSQTFRNYLKKVLSALFDDPTQYSTHSFRKGAATAASNAGVSLDLIKSMGRWKSTCFFKYTVHEMEDVGSKITSKI